MLRARSLSTLLAALVLLVAGCASTGGARGDAGSSVFVTVQNNSVPPQALTVHIVSDAGMRAILGSVSPGAVTRLDYRGSRPGTRYRLMARTTSGTELFSQPFSLVEGESILWDISANAIRTL